MKKRFVITVVIGVIVTAGLWSRVDALTQPKPDKLPISQPSNIPSNTPSEEPSSTPTPTPSPSPSNSQNDEPSDKPSPSPSETKPAETKPPKPAKPPVEQVDPPLENSELNALLMANLPDLNVKKNKQGLAIVTNTSSLFVVVNKKRNLPSTYTPSDLVVPDVAFSFSGDSPKKQMRKEAAKALESLFEAAKKDGFTLKAVSGYRSYASQKDIFERNAAIKGEEVANRTSARPGQSEHQTGLAMDVSSASADYALEENFGDTKEGKWLAKHAADHGFIIRFLKGKESITGYSYEPWHVRYVGKEAAKEIADKKLTLEQYFDAVAADHKKMS